MCRNNILIFNLYNGPNLLFIKNKGNCTVTTIKSLQL